MKVGSLFSGVGGFDLGFERAGFEVAYQVEFDKHAQAVLKRHWPNTPLFEDVRNVTATELPAVDVLVGGFPCQDLSVAGRRAGLAGARSGLFYEFARIIEETGPEWVVIENVPGLLSSRGGRDMGAVLGTLSELGYGWAYRVLDSQYFGVPQRRRRVFIVGRAGARSRSCAEVLFEPDSVLGNPPPSRTPGQEVAGSLGGGAGNRGWCNDLDRSGAFVAAAPTHDVSPTLIGAPGRGYRSDDGSDAYVLASPLTASAGHHGHSSPRGGGAYVLSERGREGGSATEIEWELSPALRGADGGSSRSNRIARVASPLTASAGHHGHSSPRGDGSDNLVIAGAQALSYTPAETTGTMTANWYKGPGNTQVEMGCIQPISGIVRRLTPKECERLQGFPDDWTAGQADSHRYRQMGNAVSVPVGSWIAARIQSHA